MFVVFLSSFEFLKRLIFRSPGVQQRLFVLISKPGSGVSFYAKEAIYSVDVDLDNE